MLSHTLRFGIIKSPGGEEGERGGHTNQTPCNYLPENDVWAIRVHAFTLRNTPGSKRGAALSAWLTKGFGQGYSCGVRGDTGCVCCSLLGISLPRVMRELFSKDFRRSAFLLMRLSGGKRRRRNVCKSSPALFTSFLLESASGLFLPPQ